MFSKKKNNIKNHYPTWLTIPAILIYTVFFILPVIMSIVLSTTDWNITRLTEPSFSGIKNYAIILSNSIFTKSILNTLIFATATTILKTLFGLILALALVKSFRGNNILRTLYYLPCVLSIVVVGVLFTAIMDYDGMLNNILRAVGLDFIATNWLGKYGTAMASVISIESWMWSGFCMFIFIAGLQAIPQSFYESAAIDGASTWQKFRHITLPLLVPSFTVVITLNITGGMKVFDIVYVLTNGGPGFDTQVLNTYTYRAFGLGLLGEAAASAVVLAIIVVIIAFIINRKLTNREVEI